MVISNHYPMIFAHNSSYVFCSSGLTWFLNSLKHPSSMYAGSGNFPSGPSILWFTLLRFFFSKQYTWLSLVYVSLTVPIQCWDIDLGRHWFKLDWTFSKSFTSSPLMKQVSFVSSLDSTIPNHRLSVTVGFGMRDGVQQTAWTFFCRVLTSLSGRSTIWKASGYFWHRTLSVEVDICIEAFFPGADGCCGCACVWEVPVEAAVDPPKRAPIVLASGTQKHGEQNPTQTSHNTSNSARETANYGAYPSQDAT